MKASHKIDVIPPIFHKVCEYDVQCSPRGELLNPKFPTTITDEMERKLHYIE
jgi:hypothetical protein